jgi:aminoglycoside phosphotransferase (APT) family kinase protein
MSTTTETDAKSSEPVIDTTALAAWLDTQDIPGKGAPLECSFVSGGSQNEIFQIRRGDLHAALRKPPTGAPAARDEGIIREWRIIKGLDGTEVPHTAAIGVCEDSSVLGRPFYLMGFVEGWSPMGGELPEPFNADREARRGLAYELVSGIVSMGNVDWRAQGMGDLGRPDGFHDRQVPRWTSFYERVRSRDVPGYDEATAWLAARRPIDFVPGVMHGDYQFANVMYYDGAPAKLAAVIDWEMGTIGDPKLDLGWTMHSWPEDPDALTDKGGYIDMRGMPTRQQMIDFYHEQSGRQIDDMDYYFVLARWKLAIVLEQGYRRAGNDPKLQAFGNTVLDLMKSAADFAESSDYPATK